VDVRRVGAFAADPRSPREARHAIEELLGPALDDETRAAVLLAVSELATNAVLHARTTFEVRLGFGADCVRIEVADGDPTIPEPGSPDLLDVSGRGLLLVAGIAERWGVEPRPRGKTVWFERRVARTRTLVGSGRRWGG